MVTAGIDVGAENTKAVILGDNKIISYSIISNARDDIGSVAQKALIKAIENAAITRAEIEYIVSTGTWREYVSFAHELATESSSCARGAAWLLPSAYTVIDMGADKCLIVKCQDGKPINSVRNDRCASGTGRFLKISAKPLGVEVEEMGRLSLQSHEDVNINNTCAVFAESEIISLIHLKQRREDISKAVFKGLARRIYSMLLKVGFQKDLAMIGGVAKNVGMVKAMEEETDSDIIVPKEPMIVGALGAALIAEEKAKPSLEVVYKDPPPTQVQ